MSGFSGASSATKRRSLASRIPFVGEREGAGLVEALLAQVELGVGVDERLEAPVLWAALAQEHAVVADVHLRVDDRLADRTDRLRVLEEHLVPVDLFVSPGQHHAPFARIRPPVRCAELMNRFPPWSPLTGT